MIVLLKDNVLTENTPLGGNIDVDKLRQCILDAQATRLEELLGEELYNKIVEDYSDETLEGDYLKLYEDYLVPFLIRQSAVEYLKIGAYSIGNNGIVVPTPQNTTAISEAQLSSLINTQETKADMYADRMYRWLCKNSLPEWNSSSDKIVNPHRPTISNWYLKSNFIDEDIWVLSKQLKS
jgi:DNA-binding transcriptional ArsR family regulator